MTINQQIQLFSNIADAHKQIKDFGFGEPWQIEEAMNKKKGVKYPMMWVAPISSTTFEQVEERTYMFMIFDLVSKTKEADKNNRNEVWSDAEDILKDIIKIFKYESDDYELVNDPILFPFQEEMTDWVTGYRAELTIRTQFSKNYCDVPAYPFISPEYLALTTVTIKDQFGNVLATLKGGQSYEVTVFDTIQDTITLNVTTITDQL
jgi:hypothetical protein